MDSKKCCNMYYGCKNQRTDLCKECKSNYKIKSYYEGNFKITCHNPTCLYNVNLNCTHRKEVNDYGKNCSEK